MSACRLLVVINNYPPDYLGGAAIVGDLCQALAADGFEVTVRCAYPYYPEWRDKSGRNGWRIWRYREGGVQVERYGLYIPADPNSILQRLVHEASFLLSLLRSLPRGRRFDVVMAYCPAVSCLGFAAVNRLVWRQRLWLNVQDLAAEAAAASGLVKRGWLGQALRAVQAWFFNRADAWSTISPVMAERLAPMRRRSQPLLTMPNWLNETLRVEIDCARAAAPATRAGAPLRLLYSGNIGRKQNLLALLQELQRTPHPFDFAIHGSGAQAGEVEAWVQRSADPRFRFGPFLGERDFAAVLVASDFCVISETADSGASFMPSKLIPAIHAGTPILALCDEHGPLGTEVLAHGLGPWFPWRRVGEIGAWLPGVGDDEHARWRDNCLRRAADYSRARIQAGMAAGLRALAAGAPIGATR